MRQFKATVKSTYRQNGLSKIVNINSAAPACIMFSTSLTIFKSSSHLQLMEEYSPVYSHEDTYSSGEN